MNLTVFINALSQDEVIIETSSITATLANLTAPTSEPILAKEIDLVVTTVSVLNK